VIKSYNQPLIQGKFTEENKTLQGSKNNQYSGLGRCTAFSMVAKSYVEGWLLIAR